MLLQVPFSTFDILTDDEVRQGLKTFSNWPTYPQVYVKVGQNNLIIENMCIAGSRNSPFCSNIQI